MVVGYYISLISAWFLDSELLNHSPSHVDHWIKLIKVTNPNQSSLMF